MVCVCFDRLLLQCATAAAQLIFRTQSIKFATVLWLHNALHANVCIGKRLISLLYLIVCLAAKCVNRAIHDQRSMTNDVHRNRKMVIQHSTIIVH